MPNTNERDALIAARDSSEPMVRFCPNCGSIGGVPDTYRDCCPDGSDARVIPAKLAEKCRGLFKLAIEPAATAPNAGAPLADESEARDRAKKAWLAEAEESTELEAYDRGWKDRAATPVGPDAVDAREGVLQQALIALGLMLSYHGQGAADYADVAQVRAQEAYDAIDTALAAAPAQQAGAPLPLAPSEAVEFDDYPDFNPHAMGCGLEDRGITDRYEAMRYGWEEAMERVQERIESFLADLPATPPQAPPLAPSEAVRDVLAEREKQRTNYGDPHDDEHGHRVLSDEAAGYLLSGQAPMRYSWCYNSKVRDRDPRRIQLVKGVALGLAAIECLDRGPRYRATAPQTTLPASEPEGELRDESKYLAHRIERSLEDFSQSEGITLHRGFLDRCAKALRAQPQADAAEPVAKWIDDPHDIDQGQMLNPAWLKLHGLTAQQAQAPGARGEQA